MPSRGAFIGLAVTAGEVSVSPYPSVMGNPMPAKNSATGIGSGALPDTRHWSRPPTFSRIFENTSRSARAVCTASRPPGFRPRAAARPRADATRSPH